MEPADDTIKTATVWLVRHGSARSFEADRREASTRS
jgi:hypothetical protein